MKNKVFLLCFSFFSIIASCQHHREENSLVVSIEEPTVEKHLYVLASDEMEGRKAGTPGIEKAAQYIENEFKTIGLSTFEGLVSYRQNFEREGLQLFNVVGVLEGKSKKQEYVVISAHYDHLGMKNDGVGDQIFNGADDDASGVAAILTLAKYFAKKGSNERTIIFIAFTHESKERELFGVQ